MPSPPPDDRLTTPAPAPAPAGGLPASAADPALAETRPHADRAAPDLRGGDPLIGQCVRAYRIVRELGRGGMGVVYAAEHVDIGQRAAVKTLNLQRLGGSASDPAITQRFLTEAKALAIARHPGLVQLFDYGQLADGTLFLLMEFLDGESLADRRESQRRQSPESTQMPAMAPRQAVRIGRQIADALTLAHEKGIFHRDLKPSNVFLIADSEAESGERVKILDFGLARIAQAAGQDAGTAATSPASVARTSTSVVMGTPIYMAPEQCRGLAQADGQADVYSLGVLLYELLAGTPPFLADTSGDLIAMHIYRTPTPLQRKAPDVPRPLADLVMRMLRKEPEQRPTMAAVSRALRLIEAQGPEAPRPTATRRLLPWGLAATLLAAGLLWRLRSAEQRPVPPPIPPATQPTTAQTATAQPTTAQTATVKPATQPATAQPTTLQPTTAVPAPATDSAPHPDASVGAASPAIASGSGQTAAPQATASHRAGSSAPGPDRPASPTAAPTRDRAARKRAGSERTADPGTPAAKPGTVPTATSAAPSPSTAPAPAPAKPDEEVNVPALR